MCEGLDRMKLPQDSPVMVRCEGDNELSHSVQSVERLVGFLEESFITELVQICET